MKYKVHLVKYGLSQKNTYNKKGMVRFKERFLLHDLFSVRLDI